MQSVFIELTKYIFAFLMAFYVLSAYRGAIIHKEEKRKGIYIQQYLIIFAIHFLGYYVLYIMKQGCKIYRFLLCTAYISGGLYCILLYIVSEGIKAAG